jgi:predicted nucleotidyltransferase
VTSPREPALPVGTQVVLRHGARDLDGGEVLAGATGRVRGQDGGRYLLELPDGRGVRCARGAVELRRRWQAQVALGPAPPDGHALVRERTVYAAVVGSRAFGLDVEDSDVDVRGTYQAPTAAFWSLGKPPAHVEGPGPEQFSWELERFCELALKANPNLLEVLHSPDVLVCTEVGEELLALRPAFVSRLAHTTYAGYVLSQAKKLQADVRQHGRPRWKHVMHLLRLLLSARDLLRTGALSLDVGEHRERLLAVKRGEVAWDAVERWRQELQREVDAALPRSPLPEAPDVAAVDAWLVDVRRRDL